MWHSQDSNLNLTGSQTILFYSFAEKKNKGRKEVIRDRGARRQQRKKQTKNIFENLHYKDGDQMKFNVKSVFTCQIFFFRIFNYCLLLHKLLCLIAAYPA